MCNFCETTDNFISETFETKTGIEVVTDVRFDAENNEIDACYGILGVDEETEWTNAFKINYCPVCGRKL